MNKETMRTIDDLFIGVMGPMGSSMYGLFAYEALKFMNKDPSKKEIYAMFAFMSALASCKLAYEGTSSLHRLFNNK